MTHQTKEYFQEYYKKNRHRIRERMRKQRFKNRHRLNAERRAARKKDPDRYRRAEHKYNRSEARKRTRLKRVYGLDWSEYQRLASRGCAICGSRDSLVVDHQHKPFLFRGVLCNEHNLMLGYAGDSPKILRAAAAYLEKARKK